MIKSIKKFGVNPEEIIYVDDMATVLDEAKKLRIKTVGCKSRISDNLDKADYQINKLTDLLDIIR